MERLSGIAAVMSPLKVCICLLLNRKVTGCFRRCQRSDGSAAKAGEKGEDAACAYLERKGYVICRRNYRCRYGEIDIIAAKGGELSFVEVKTRRNLNFGLPRLAVTYAKQQKIRSAALFYLQQENRHQQMLSFDVIEILVEGNVARLHHLPHCF